MSGPPKLTEDDFRARCMELRAAAEALRNNLRPGHPPVVRRLAAEVARLAGELAARLAHEPDAYALATPGGDVQLQQLRLHVLHAARQALAAEEQIRLRALSPDDASAGEETSAGAVNDRHGREP